MPNLPKFHYIVSGIALSSGQGYIQEVDLMREPYAKHLRSFVFCCWGTFDRRRNFHSHYHLIFTDLFRNQK